MKSVRKNIRYWGLVAVVCLLMVLGDSVSGYTAVKNPNNGSDATDTIIIVAGQSKVVKAPWPTIRVAVTDPKIANVQMLTPDQVLVQGNKVGSTDLIMWNEDETEIWQSKVYISLDVKSHQQKLYQLLPYSNIELDQSGEVLLVKGVLRSADDAVQLHDYLDKTGVKYSDMTSVAGAQQVQLQVRIAEVSRTAMQVLGINASYGGHDFAGLVQPTSYGGTPLPLDWTIGQDVSFGEFSSATTVFAEIPGSDLDIFVQALAENQYLRVLANPTLVALSGEEASFLAGGEFPIPVVQSGTSDAITIDYREYGVRLIFRPVVLGDGKIRLYAAPEVSDLTTVGSVTVSGFEVPALRTRKAETTLELKSGQTFAMAGLIKRNDDAVTSRIPGFGDLPVIGALFRSIRYERGETELVVLVTASLVEPMSLREVPPLPGFLHEVPNDWEVYIDGKIEGVKPAEISPADAEWLRKMGLDKLFGPGAWDSYTKPRVPSRADIDTEGSAIIEEEY